MHDVVSTEDERLISLKYVHSINVQLTWCLCSLFMLHLTGNLLDQSDIPME